MWQKGIVSFSVLWWFIGLLFGSVQFCSLECWKLLFLLNSNFWMGYYFLQMRYDEVGTHLKHPKTINNNIKNLRIFPFYPYTLRILCYHLGSTPEAPQRPWENTPKGTSWTLPLRACFKNKVWETKDPLQCIFKESRSKSRELWVKLQFSDLNWIVQSKDPIQTF